MCGLLCVLINPSDVLIPPFRNDNKCKGDRERGRIVYTSNDSASPKCCQHG